MYFNEPPPTAFDLKFSLFGIPVRVSPWFWLAGAILGFELVRENPKLFIIWEAAVFLSILLHEMGHAVVMRQFGESPRVVLYQMGGLAIGDGRGARGATEQIIVSAAGPVIQLLLAAFCLALVRASGHVYPADVPFWNNAWLDLSGEGLAPLPFKNLNFFFAFLLWINVFWALVNLLPVFPLDGGQISRALFSIWSRRDSLRQSLMLSIAAGGGAALYGFTHGQTYMGILFALLAFDSYQALQMLGGGGRWR